jgi:hypothetical protein
MHHVSHLLNGDKRAAHEWPAGLLALDLLLEAHADAQATGADVWQFAVEIDHLLAFGASVGQLRRWADRGLVLHGVETTQRTSRVRTFDRVEHLHFSRRDCFVLTDDGVLKASQKVAQATWVPRWDGRRLYWGKVIVKRFRQPATNQKLILDAFQELGWVREIDDPLPGMPDQDPRDRLRNTILALNRNMQEPLIHFGGNGTRDGVRWDYAGDGEAPEVPSIYFTSP